LVISIETMSVGIYHRTRYWSQLIEDWLRKCIDCAMYSPSDDRLPTWQSIN